jgi:hypothetical protein
MKPHLDLYHSAIASVVDLALQRALTSLGEGTRV